ncbi:helix-turn-helix domain-containing protein [Thiolapillus sp.]|uniref:helix-turn-helix domain-containing protein n=1 Tax=Thiolapillus sp. TaxID=2017437 RepID=UPI003AF6AE92
MRSSLSPVRLAQRAQIVLMANEGMRNQDIANALGIGRVKVSRWRNRYAQSGLAGIERDLPRGAPPQKQACLRPRDRFWDIPVPKIDSAFDNLFVPQPSWSPSTAQQLRKLVAAPYLPPNDWTPRLGAYFASPLALCARRVSSAASRLLGSTSLRFALHGWQRWT